MSTPYFGMVTVSFVVEISLEEVDKKGMLTQFHFESVQ